MRRKLVARQSMVEPNLSFRQRHEVSKDSVPGESTAKVKKRSVQSLVLYKVPNMVKKRPVSSGQPGN